MSLNINKILGNEIRKYREAQNLSQLEFAEMCGISRAYYGRIERGEHSATIELCLKISTKLGIRLADLFDNLPI